MSKSSWFLGQLVACVALVCLVHAGVVPAPSIKDVVGKDTSWLEQGQMSAKLAKLFALIGLFGDGGTSTAPPRPTAAVGHEPEAVQGEWAEATTPLARVRFYWTSRQELLRVAQNLHAAILALDQKDNPVGEIALDSGELRRLNPMRWRSLVASGYSENVRSIGDGNFFGEYREVTQFVMLLPVRTEERIRRETEDLVKKNGEVMCQLTVNAAGEPSIRVLNERGVK